MRTVLFLFAFTICSNCFSQKHRQIDSLENLLLSNLETNKFLNAKLCLAELLENVDRSRSKRLAQEVLNAKFKNFPSDSMKSAAYLRLGIAAYKEKKDSIALIYLNKIDTLYQINNEIIPPLIQSKVYRSEISKFTFSMKGILAAKKYILEGMQLANKANNESFKNLMTYRLAEWHGFFSQAESPEKHLDTARMYFEKVLPYYKNSNNLEYESKIYYGLASVAVYRKKYDAAENYYLLRLETIKKTNDSIKIGDALASLGGYYRRTKQSQKAIEKLDQAMAIANSKGYSDLGKQGELMHTYALVREQQEDYKAAMSSLFKELKIRDSLFKNENTQRGVEMAAKYESEKKQQEITLLKSQKELAEQQKKNQRNLLLGGLGLTTAAGVFLFLGFRNRKKTNDKLRELDATKSNFFANISHEFRTPLSLISGPIQEQLNKPDLPLQEKQHLYTAQRNSQRLLTLVDQLLDLSKLESGHFKLKIQQGDLDTFLKSIAASFEFLAATNNQNYKVTISIVKGIHWFDADALEKITTNLLANAIKYSPENADIHFSASLNNDKLHMSVKNSGIALPSETLSTLFDRFKRADETTTGSGIGLALTKELVTLHKGNIIIKNENDWMIFETIIPVNSDSFTSEERADGMITVPVNDTYTTHGMESAFAKASSIQNSSEEQDIFAKDTSPLLLIVDDNADLRAYVSSLFKEKYTIHIAEDGEKGFAIAQEIIPDLIITDLMMPKEDGLILTKNCKTTAATSHIPVLMLTAKAGDQHLLEGLETGADAYLTKPFNTEILKTTAHNLLETRRKLQERFSQEVVLLPKELASNSVEEKFLENLKIVLDTKLIESDFNTENFAQALGMSRMQLHRKLKALTGLSATEFVRLQRLKLAAQLLKKSDINVSQVGYSVGFNNHSYFTKCFKKQYGIAPSEYAKTK